MMHSNFWFNIVWHRQNVAALVLCWRLVESDVTAMPTVTCMYYVDVSGAHGGAVVEALRYKPEGVG
jgi:hypothetical protein